MLPAFHGDKVAELGTLVAEVAEAEIARWPAAREVTLHEPLQRVTLEIILRAVFGVGDGPLAARLRDGLAAMLAFAERPASLFGPPPGSLAERAMRRVGPWARFAQRQAESTR